MVQISIKNRVCARCLKSVAGIFRAAGAQLNKIELGSVIPEEPLPTGKLQQAREALEAEGFAIIDDQQARLGYSSVAHLSGQFKKITGFTPSQFKKLKEHSRRELGDL